MFVYECIFKQLKFLSKAWIKLFIGKYYKTIFESVGSACSSHNGAKFNVVRNGYMITHVTDQRKKTKSNTLRMWFPDCRSFTCDLPMSLYLSLRSASSAPFGSFLKAALSGAKSVSGPGPVSAKKSNRNYAKITTWCLHPDKVRSVNKYS